jgi:hypothetical protein
MKIGRRLRCSSVTSRTIFILTGQEPNSGSIKMVRDAPSNCQSGSDRLAGGPFLIATKDMLISGTGDKLKMF